MEDFAVLDYIWIDSGNCNHDASIKNNLSNMHMPDAVSLACGTRYMIQEQVRGAHTGKPIEAAAVAIHWNKYKI